jgi:hypothetical protein
MPEREHQPPSDEPASTAPTSEEDLETSAEDFKPFPRKRFWRQRRGSSPAPQEPTRLPDETAAEG